jgi:hypothetical protein
LFFPIILLDLLLVICYTSINPRIASCSSLVGRLAPGRGLCGWITITMVSISLGCLKALDKNKFAARRSRCSAKINSMSHSHRKGGGSRRFAVGLTHHPTNWLGRQRGGTRELLATPQQIGPPFIAFGPGRDNPGRGGWGIR